ncbi:hypothetical protein A9Q99_17985 [Gammaproteobacteria bacterium 45_16_T64]|nr:hypothetical protein A9Q99_17985 [Gammaproteobacteria bacterium 45_16_T64]
MSAYPSDSYLVELKGLLDEYFPNNIKETLKPKREAMIAKSYGDVFDIQCEAITVIGAIEVSHLLGMNDVIVPILAEEYGKLLTALKALEKATKAIKQFSELKETLDRVKKVAKLSEVSNYLYKDLEYLTETYGLDIDAKEIVTNVKKLA